MKTRVGLKCPVNDCGCPQMDMDAPRPVTAKVDSGPLWMALSGDGSLRVIVDPFGWMVLDGCEWFWALADSFRWIQVVFRDLQL